MQPNDNAQWRLAQAIDRVLAQKRLTVVRMMAFIAMMMLSIQPVVAQSALEEATDVACSGALGQAIFLFFGLLTLVLILVGLAQIALGFLGTGRGGRRGERNTVVNGAITLLGGLFLGSMGAVLDFLGVNVDSCLAGGEVLVVMSLMI